MRILFVSSSPLKKEISIGNTFLNLFKDMNDVALASIYTRSGTPDPEISQAFCITEKMLIKNLLGKGPAGVRVDSALFSAPSSSVKEQKQISFIKSHRWTIFFWIQNLVWRIGRWESKELQEFIEDFKPDLIFTLLSDCSFLNRIILHVKKVANIPLAVYAWDNNFSLKRLMFSPFKWIDHLANRQVMKKVVKHAEIMYVISDVQKKDYERAFRRKCKVLTKGENFTEDILVKNERNQPLQLIFTGNIGLNRWKSLAHIANALEKINQNGVKAQLRIYTGTAITTEMQRALHKGDSSFLMGSVSAEEVIALQNRADILVHVEALDLKNKLLVRQSFSTKLVDYFHQGKCIVAFGPKDVASISHLIKNDAAITADTENELEEKLKMLIETPELIQEYGQKAWECGKRNHHCENITSMLEKDFEEII